MTAEQWGMVEAHFAALCEATVDAWPAGLAAIADEHVRAEVASLLEHTKGGSDTVNVVIGAAATEIPEETGPGRRIGPFRVIRRLGMGGQGTVFEAVRADGSFEQRVAIKIMKWEMDTPAARLQFRNERQILAGLEHPHIARLLDGGETEDGVPYIVMEFIDGVPISEGVSAWTAGRKLELFLKVADAVAYAHRNLVVHRDLKPGNILLTTDGNPKVLDFGIARLIDSEATRTSTGLWALTPDYASPEQVRGLPVSTVSDVYSLGIVLYEVLAGRRPYNVRQASPTELIRLVCQQDPEPPGCGDELDHIVMMALRKEPERRYSSVEHFSEDVRRFLAQEPVLAKPATIGYRAKKFARRHASAVLASAVLLMALAGGIVASQYQARRAERRFEQLRHLANTFVFAVDDSVRNLAGSTDARQLIVKTGLEYLDSLSAEAGNDVTLKLELAGAYQKIADVLGSPSEANLGRAPEAIENYRKGRRLLEDVIAAEPRNAKALRNLAYLAPKTGDLYLSEGSAAAAKESFEVGRKAIEQARSAGIHDAFLEFLDGGIYLREGDALSSTDTRQATRLFEQALAAYQRAATLERTARYRRGVGVAFARVARVRLNYGEVGGAAKAFEESLKISRELATENPNDQAMLRGYAVSLMNSADAQGLTSIFSLGNTAEALRRYELAQQINDRLMAIDSKSVLSVTDGLLIRSRVGAILATSKPAEAIRVLNEALSMAPRLGATVRRPNIQTAIGLIHQRLATAHLLLHQLDPALREAREAVTMLGGVDADVSANLALGDVQVASGHAREAIEMWERTAERFKGIVAGQDLSQSASDIRDVASLLERLGDQGANPCLRYRQAAKLWDVCANRGAPAGTVPAKLAAKVKSCTAQNR